VGSFGAFLLNEALVVTRIVRAGAAPSSMLAWQSGAEAGQAGEAGALPLFCKTRLLPTLDRTVRFSKQLQRSGCSLLTLHARLPSAKHSGAVDYAAVTALVKALSIPVVLNGGVASKEEGDDALNRTGAAAVMAATNALANPRLFAGLGMSRRVRGAEEGKEGKEGKGARRGIRSGKWKV